MEQKLTNNITAAAAKGDIGGDPESIICSHSKFFDHLIELIPARFYLPNDDADSKPWYQGLSKIAKLSIKKQTRQNIKIARRNRFDPDKDPSTLHLLQQQQSCKATDPEEGNLPSHEEEDELGPKPIFCEGDKENKATYEELREKLHKKIELLRGNRVEKKPEEKNRKNDRNKRKRGAGDQGPSEEAVDLSEQDEEEIIEYGKVKLGDEDDGKRGKNKRIKLSKAKELERARKSQELRKHNPFIAERESWKAATSRAMGEKVHDNPRLIKESMNREKRKKLKNAEKWKERVETQEKMKEERQRKRKDNIEGRINDKRTRKIARREKKLMRPGFEGRKEGFITNE